MIARWIRSLVADTLRGRNVLRWLLLGSAWELTHVDAKRYRSLNSFARLCHQASVAGGWWHDLATGQPLNRNKGEMLMLMVSELAEAMEGERKSLMDDKLPHRKMAEVEMADALIRIFDYAGAPELHGGVVFDLDGAVAEKMAFNRAREDHKPENRRLAGGKAF